MWQSFKSMPFLLKILTGHALVCSLLLVGSIIPHEAFKIGDRSVSYAEWWSSGYGPLAAVVGITMPLAAFLMLRRSRFSRMLYLAALAIPAVGPDLVRQRYTDVAANILVIFLLALYLYFRAPVTRYFGSNNSFKPNPLRGFGATRSSSGGSA